MKQLHVKFSDEEWKMLNDIFNTRKNEFEDALMRKVTLTGTIKDAIITSYMIHVDKNFCLMPRPKEEEDIKEEPLTDKKAKKEIHKLPNGAKIILKPRLKNNPA